MKKLRLCLIFAFVSIFSVAQEFDCRIQVSAQKIQGTSNEKTFQAMERALMEFVNNTKWTNHVFAREERIECNIMIIINEQISSDEFKGNIQATFSRPVYGTSYTSPILNHRDEDFTFRYNEFQALEFNLNSFTSNLTSVVAYYCYLILGLDYETFSPNGGTQFFQKCEKIVQNAQGAQEAGWKAYESLKNRYWIIENMLGEQYIQLRDFYYLYHRMGMDKLADKPNEARAAIEQSIEGLRNVYRKKPSSILMTMILSVKGDEIVNIFSEAFPDEKARIVNMLKEIDPANSSKYEKIMKDSN